MYYCSLSFAVFGRAVLDSRSESEAATGEALQAHEISRWEGAGETAEQDGVVTARTKLWSACYLLDPATRSARARRRERIVRRCF